jgi:hypothetical protein
MLTLMQYVFYVDDNNILHHVTPNADGFWDAGNLITDIPGPIKVAAYSKLAAITRSGASILVYYQSSDKDATIRSVSFKERPAPPVRPVPATSFRHIPYGSPRSTGPGGRRTPTIQRGDQPSCGIFSMALA